MWFLLKGFTVVKISLIYFAADHKLISGPLLVTLVAMVDASLPGVVPELPISFPDLVFHLIEKYPCLATEEGQDDSF